MKNLNYKEVKEEIAKRMINFDKERIANKTKLTLNTEKDKALDFKSPLTEKGILIKEIENNTLSQENKAETINVKSNNPPTVASTNSSDSTNVAVNESTKKATKENKGLFKSIAEFFSDDPKLAQAAKLKEQEKKRLEAEKKKFAIEQKRLVEAEKKRLADEKKRLDEEQKKLAAEQKKLAAQQKKK